MTDPTDLQRRQELAKHTKPELIDIIMQMIAGIGALSERVDRVEP